MATQKLEIIIDVDYDNKVIKQAKKDTEDFNKTLEKSGSQSDGFGSKLKAARGEIDKFTVGLVAAGKFLKTVFDAANEGFELLQLTNQFDRLTASIQTTSNALLNDMSRAARGQISDAELMATANQIISLGLAKTHEDVVRLATAVTSLGLDMQQVTLTLANDSTARLDSLGLSIERVTALQKEFTAAGQETGKAFDSAVLVALEERMGLLGVSAGGAVNPLSQVAVEFENIANNAKMALFEGIEPSASAFAALLNQVDKNKVAIEENGIATMDYLTQVARATDNQEEFIDTYIRLTGYSLAAAESFYKLQQRLAGEELGAAQAADRTEQLSDKQQQLAIQTQHTSDVVAEQARVLAAQTAEYDELNAALGDVVYTQTAATQAANDNFIVYDELTGSLAEFSIGLADVTTQHEAWFRALGGTSEALGSVVTGVQAQSEALAGPFFSALQDGVNGTENFNLLLLNEAAAAGAGASELALLASMTGEFSDAQIEAALQSALMQQKIQELAAAVANGSQSVASAVAELEAFKQSIENIPPGKTFTLNIQTQGSLPDFATGTGADTNAPQAQQFGGIAMGGMSLVGERGPELVNLPRGSQVTTNHNYNLTLQSAASSAGVIQDFNTMRALAG